MYISIIATGSIIQVLAMTYGMEHLSRVMLVQYVEKLRGLTLKGKGTVYNLYKLINAIEDNICL